MKRSLIIPFLFISILVVLVRPTPSEKNVGLKKIESRHVDIWSDGTRLSGDLFFPANNEDGVNLPVIILCHGWGGVRSHLNQDYAPVEFAEQLKVPLLIMVAEKEELMDNRTHGLLAYNRAKDHVPAQYEVMKGLTHFDIYQKGRTKTIELAIAWFNKYLK